ncbi:MAG: hypothetical protein COA88_12950 [Kordia sp.]|nr:MAG: hypothetical protein COA88_12950 [Kordia sp.]
MIIIKINNEIIPIDNLDKAIETAQMFRLYKPINKERKKYWNLVFLELLTHKLSGADSEIKFNFFNGLLEEFLTIPLTKDGFLKSSFLEFEKGVNVKEDIWTWFEEVFEVSMASYFEKCNSDVFL